MSRKLRIGASGLLLGWLAWRTDWRQADDAFTHLRVGYWLLAVLTYALAQVISSVRWALLARPLGFRQPVRQFIGFYYIGMFFNLVLPTSVGGDVVRAWYLDGGSGRRFDAFVSVLADRGSGLVILVLMGGAAVLLCPLDLPPAVSRTVGGLAGGTLLGLAALPLVLRYTRRFDRARQIADKGLVYLRDVRLLALTTVLSVLVQTANVLLVWLIGLSINAPVRPAFYWVLMPAVTIVTLLPVSVNGMGVREGATVVLLGAVGVGAGTAVSLALLWFLAGAAVGLSGAGFYLLGNFPRFQVQRDDEAVGGDSDQGRARQPRAAA